MIAILCAASSIKSRDCKQVLEKQFSIPYSKSMQSNGLFPCPNDYFALFTWHIAYIKYDLFMKMSWTAYGKEKKVVFYNVTNNDWR